MSAIPTPRAVILAGTRIGKNSVVGCGAVCMREYPENVIIMGNPAKPVATVPGAAAVSTGVTLDQKSPG